MTTTTTRQEVVWFEKQIEYLYDDVKNRDLTQTQRTSAINRMRKLEELGLLIQRISCGLGKRRFLNELSKVANELGMQRQYEGMTRNVLATINSNSREYYRKKNNFIPLEPSPPPSRKRSIQKQQQQQRSAKRSSTIKQSSKSSQVL